MSKSRLSINAAEYKQLLFPGGNSIVISEGGNIQRGCGVGDGQQNAGETSSRDTRERERSLTPTEHPLFYRVSYSWVLSSVNVSKPLKDIRHLNGTLCNLQLYCFKKFRNFSNIPVGAIPYLHFIFNKLFSSPILKYWIKIIRRRIF